VKKLEKKPELFWVMRPVSSRLSYTKPTKLKSETQSLYSRERQELLRNISNYSLLKEEKLTKPERKLLKLTNQSTFLLKNGSKLIEK